MTRKLLIAGAGMGGLAAALAAARAGWTVDVHEQASALSEVGAGIQLGPNATRILEGWGLADAAARVACSPERLIAYSAVDARELGRLRLGDAFTQRYGAPYLTIHRADLQRLLLDAATRAGAHVEVNSRATAVHTSDTAVLLRINDTADVQGDALIAADGLWSHVREIVFGDGRPAPTGHVAYRGLASQSQLPLALRSRDVRVWLGPKLHVVAYPVRGGDELNVVVIVQGRAAGAPEDWDQTGAAADLRAAMGPLCKPLQDLMQAMPSWRLWTLHDRPPLHGADQMTQGRVALLGDAAHPMRPYLAQGAGMAIEDAAEIGRQLAEDGNAAADVPGALRRYAQARWQRCAQVQSRAQRNGRIFHATGIVQWGRDAAMRLLGERLLDQPWLYR